MQGRETHTHTDTQKKKINLCTEKVGSNQESPRYSMGLDHLGISTVLHLQGDDGSSSNNRIWVLLNLQGFWGDHMIHP